MRQIVLLSAIFFLNLTFSQEIKLINGKGFSGAIFSENKRFQNKPNQQFFTPSEMEIQNVEAQLKNEIKSLNRNYRNQNPRIDNNLKFYVRQYVGYVNENGEKVIHINFLPKTYSEIGMDNVERKVWKERWIEMEDGGSSYWQIKYSLKTKSFFDFFVNGNG